MGEIVVYIFYASGIINFTVIIFFAARDFYRNCRRDYARSEGIFKCCKAKKAPDVEEKYREAGPKIPLATSKSKSNGKLLGKKKAKRKKTLRKAKKMA